MSIPTLPGPDQTLAFLREGYAFIGNRCDALDTDAFHTRLMLRRATCIRGEDAARIFYDDDRFTRRNGAMPPTTMRLLQDRGSVQGMDGAAHRQRKALFVNLLMTDTAEDTFLHQFRHEWLTALSRWESLPRIVLHDEAKRILTRAVCRWMDLPAGDERMMHDLSSMIENAGRVSPAVLSALLRRRATETRLRRMVRQVRDRLTEGSPLRMILGHRDLDGEPLSEDAVVVEILNVLRPIVAIGRYIMFTAMALHDNPHWRARLTGAPDDVLQGFAEEVRRFYPFFPVIAGIVQQPFRWHGHDFKTGDWVILDLYGTTHDPRLFPSPQVFEGTRNIGWRSFDHALVPQGAGNPHQTHRCPGERLTVATMREALRLMVERMTYDVPMQDLSLPLSRMPARPARNLILSNVRRV